MQREGSIMNSDNLKYRAESMFEVVKELISFVERYKMRLSVQTVNWIHVRIFWIYTQIGNMAKQVPLNSLLYFSYFSALLKRIFVSLEALQQELCLEYYKRATFMLCEF